MRKLFSKFALVVALGLALAFTFSCSSDDKDNGGGGVCSGNGVPFNENSQIYNSDGTLYNGSGVIKIFAGGSGISNAGIVTNGIVNFDLPPTISDEYLLDEYLDDESQSFCTSYNKGIKGLNGDFVLTSSNGDNIGDLVISSGKYGDGNREDINYYYFSKANKITCNWPDGGGARIEAKVGWNRIYYHRTKNTKEHCTNNILAKEVKWILSNY